MVSRLGYWGTRVASWLDLWRIRVVSRLGTRVARLDLWRIRVVSRLGGNTLGWTSGEYVWSGRIRVVSRIRVVFWRILGNTCV